MLTGDGNKKCKKKKRCVCVCVCVGGGGGGVGGSLRANKNFAPAAHFFCAFLCHCFARLQRT